MFCGEGCFSGSFFLGEGEKDFFSGEEFCGRRREEVFFGATGVFGEECSLLEEGCFLHGGVFSFQERSFFCVYLEGVFFREEFFGEREARDWCFGVFFGRVCFFWREHVLEGMFFWRTCFLCFFWSFFFGGFFFFKKKKGDSIIVMLVKRTRGYVTAGVT